MRLIIVDDSRLIRRQMEDLVRLHFPTMDIKTAEDGQQAIQLIKMWRPQIVLLDIMMPRVTGIEVLEQLGEQTESGEIKVLMFSSVGDMVTLKQCFELGASDFISKPLDELEALARIGGAVKATHFMQEYWRMKDELQSTKAMLVACEAGRKHT